MTTAQPLNKNEAVTFTYRFRTLERRFEAVTLWVKRIEGGRYGYGCRFVNLTDGAEAAIRSFVFKNYWKGGRKGSEDKSCNDC